MATDVAPTPSADPTRVDLCGVDAAVDVVGGKWKAIILWALDQRPHRFGERAGGRGISEKVLIQQLKGSSATASSTGRCTSRCRRRSCTR